MESCILAFRLRRAQTQQSFGGLVQVDIDLLSMDGVLMRRREMSRAFITAH